MDIQILLEFISLYETCSFQETADRLCISQSALTKHIHKLEETLGVELFDRSTRSVNRSLYGDVYYPYARQLVQLYEESLHALKNLKENDDHVLHIGFTSAAAQYGIVDLLSVFAKNNPEIEIKLTENFTVTDMLLKNRCDFAFATDAAEINPKLNKIIFKMDHLAAFMHSGHPLAHKEMLSLSEIAKEKIIAHTRANGAYHIDTLKFIKQCQEQDIVPNIVTNASFTSTILKLVEQEYGIAILNHEQVPKEQLNRNIVAADIYPHIESIVFLLYNKKNKMTLARKLFITYLINSVE